MPKENTSQVVKFTGDDIVGGLIIAIAIIPIAVAVILGIRSTPNTCIVNEKQVDSSIEIQNFEPSRRWFEEEAGYHINSEGQWEGTSRMVERYEPATFEWRYVGTEDWVRESVDPAGTDNEHPYRREISHDVQVCDGRPEHAEKNGKISSTYHRVEFYI
jgi:hypothetical protein